MRVTRSLAHAALYCRDVKRSVDFYTRALGLEHLFTQERPDGTLFYEYLHAGGDTFVELFPTDAEAASQPRPGVSHLCFSVDDIDLAVKRARAAGVEVSEPKKGKDGNLQAWLEDPDGVPIELMQMMPDCRQYKALKNKGADIQDA